MMVLMMMTMVLKFITSPILRNLILFQTLMFNRCMNTMPEFKIVDLDGKTSQKTQTKDFDLEVKFQKLKP